MNVHQKKPQIYRIGDPNVDGNITINSAEFSRKYREWLKRRGFTEELRQMDSMSGFGRGRKRKILQEDSNRD